MVCIQFLEDYKGISIYKDNTLRQYRLFSVINPKKVIYASSLDIIKRKIDKLLKNEQQRKNDLIRANMTNENEPSNTKPLYKIVFDNGKPYDETATSEDDLRAKLKDFYLKNKDTGEPFNSFVYNQDGDDISESQFITEMIGEIMSESEDNE